MVFKGNQLWGKEKIFGKFSTMIFFLFVSPCAEDGDHVYQHSVGPGGPGPLLLLPAPGGGAPGRRPRPGAGGGALSQAPDDGGVAGDHREEGQHELGQVGEDAVDRPPRALPGLVAEHAALAAVTLGSADVHLKENGIRKKYISEFHKFTSPTWKA